jgi:hypothetical protein
MSFFESRLDARVKKTLCGWIVEYPGVLYARSRQPDRAERFTFVVKGSIQTSFLRHRFPH